MNYKHLTINERVVISQLKSSGYSIRKMAFLVYKSTYLVKALLFLNEEKTKAESSSSNSTFIRCILLIFLTHLFCEMSDSCSAYTAMQSDLNSLLSKVSFFHRSVKRLYFASTNPYRTDHCCANGMP